MILFPLLFMCTEITYCALLSQNTNEKKKWVSDWVWLLWFQRCETGKINTDEAKNHVRKFLFVSTAAIWKDMYKCVQCTHKLCNKKKECERYNKHTAVFPVWMCVCTHIFVSEYSFFSQVFNFRCLIFSYSFPLLFSFRLSLSLRHYAFFHLPILNVLTHFLFNRIFDSIQAKLNALVLLLRKQRNSFDRTYKLRTV